MGLRPPVNKELEIAATERLHKQVARLYTLWLVGLLVGIINIKLEHVEVGGVKFLIENPGVLQGVIFFGCIAYYVAILANAQIFSFEYVPLASGLKRRMLFEASKPRTFRGKTLLQLRTGRLTARVMLSVVRIFMVLYLLIPMIHILLFKPVSLLQGIDAIFGSASVDGGVRHG